MSYPGQQQGGSQGGGNSGSNPFDSFPTSAPTSAPSSSGVNKSVIIGGVIGGIGGLLITLGLGFWLLQRRKQRKDGTRAADTRPVTCTGVHGLFSGRHFYRSSRNQNPHSSLLPLPVSQTTHSSRSRIALRGGEASRRGSGNELDILPPSYAESQMSASLASLGRMNTTLRTNSDTSTAPLINRIPDGRNTIITQTTEGTIFTSDRLLDRNELQASTITPQTTSSAIVPQQTGTSPISYQPTRATVDAQVVPYPRQSTDTMGFPPSPAPSETTQTMPASLAPQPPRDTMAFPVEQEQIRLEPEAPISIISPIPRHPLVHRESLERVVREGMVPSETPIMGDANDPVEDDRAMPGERQVSEQVMAVEGAAASRGREEQSTVSTADSMGIEESERTRTSRDQR